LRAQTQNLYDDLGRVYESRVYEVDPGDGYIYTYLPTSYWYDDAGNLLKTATGKLSSDYSTVTGYWLANKYAYDSLGRLVMSYTCYDLDETAWADADDVAGDTVVEQTQSWYNEAGLVVATATYRRLPDDTSSTGALTTTGANASYVTAQVAWYDGLGRPSAAADLGREDTGSSYGHSFFNGSTGALLDSDADGIPNVAESNRLATYGSNGDAINDLYIVSLTQYNDAGLAYRTIDNLGRIDETQYDDAGRVTKTIQNYADGTQSGADTAQGITVEYEYDSGGRLGAMTAYNAKGSGTPEAQVTQYLYTSSINASWQTAVVYPDAGTVSTTYDRLGRTITTTDQRNIVHTYTYDTAGRLAVDAVTAPGGWGNVEHSTEAVVTTYDDMGRVEYVTSYSSSNPAQWDFEHTVNQVKYELHFLTKRP